MAKKTVAKTDKMEVARKGRKPVDPNETKEQKLERLAEARVNKAVKYISLIGNLAAYKPTAENVKNIMEALAQACANVNNRLEGTRRESYTFRLHQ